MNPKLSIAALAAFLFLFQVIGGNQSAGSERDGRQGARDVENAINDLFGNPGLSKATNADEPLVKFVPAKRWSDRHNFAANYRINREESSDPDQAAIRFILSGGDSPSPGPASPTAPNYNFEMIEDLPITSPRTAPSTPTFGQSTPDAPIELLDYEVIM